MAVTLWLPAPVLMSSAKYAAQARGKVSAEDNSLWGCLSRVEDHSTGVGVACQFEQYQYAAMPPGSLQEWFIAFMRCYAESVQADTLDTESAKHT